MAWALSWTLFTMVSSMTTRKIWEKSFRGIRVRIEDSWNMSDSFQTVKKLFGNRACSAKKG
jgi:hypothetical protein